MERLFEAARNPIHARRALFRMNAAEYKRLHEKIRSGRTTSDERRLYWSYVSLLLDDIKEAYCSTHNRLRCTNAEIRDDYQGGRYIYAKYTTAYWSIEAVVGHSDITIVACSFIDLGTDTELRIADGLGSLLLDGTSFTLPNFRPWSMDAVLYLAAKGVCICEHCLYPYELCHHHEADKKAILSL